MRKKYAVLNLITAWLGQAVIVIFNFILRGLFIKYLSLEYLGMNGLFSNVLSLLSLAELGIGTAIIYSLYEPLAKKEEIVVQALMDFYEKAYRLIGCFIFIIGIALIPFLGWFIREGTEIEGLRIIYVLFLLDSVVSYFYSYKASLIIANQKSFVVHIYTNGVKIIKIILSIIVIWIWKNYYFYLFVQLGCTLLENILISQKANRMYPFLKRKRKNILLEKKRNEIKKNTFGMMFHKVGNIVVNGTDNLIISKFVSIVSVGRISNYTMVLNVFHSFIGSVFQAFTAGIGNYAITEEREKQKQLFWQLFFMNFWLYGTCAVGLFCLFNPFICFWIGEEYTFSKGIVFLFLLNFYLTGMRKAVLTFRDAMGLFWHDRYKAFIEAIFNLVFSIILVKKMGIAGVYLGTIISTLLTCFWVEPYILFKYRLKEKMMKYVKFYGYYAFLTILAGITASYVTDFISGNHFFALLGKGIVCMIICQFIFIIGSFPINQTHLIIERIRECVRALKRR